MRRDLVGVPLTKACRKGNQKHGSVVWCYEHSQNTVESGFNTFWVLLALDYAERGAEHADSMAFLRSRADEISNGTMDVSHMQTTVINGAHFLDYSSAANSMLQANAQMADYMNIASPLNSGNLPRLVAKMAWFAKMVTNRSAGGWDLKGKSAWEAAMPGTIFLHPNDYVGFGEDELVFIVNGEKINIADLANINYGYAGAAAGFSDLALLINAGAAQLRKPSNEGGEDYKFIKSFIEAKKRGPARWYGDQQDDYESTRKGISRARGRSRMHAY